MYKVIISHYYPDYDAILAIWMLRRFGRELYLGIGDAEIRLIPAGPIPSDLIHEFQSEDGKGFLSVDTGRCDFDTHGKREKSKSASGMVAKHLGIERESLLVPLLEFVESNDGTGESIAIGDSIAQIMLWPSVIRGMHISTDWTKADSMYVLFKMLDMVTAYADFDPKLVCDFWGIEDADGYNQKLKGLVEEWFNGKSPKLCPSSYPPLAELLEGSADASSSVMPHLALLMTNRKLFELFRNRDKYPLLFIKNSLLGVLIYHALMSSARQAILASLSSLLESLVNTEMEWAKTIEDIRSGSNLQVYPLKTRSNKSKFNFVYVDHPSSLILKAIRHEIKQPGIILAVNSLHGTVSVTCSRTGPLKDLRLNHLAGLMRRGEAYASGVKWNMTVNRSQETGNILGWYLHDSERMLMYGSFKSPNHFPSKMSKKQMVNLVAVSLNHEIPVSTEFGCPGTSCAGRSCPFSDLHLPICEQVRAASSNPFAQALFPAKIQAARELGLY